MKHMTTLDTHTIVHQKHQSINGRGISDVSPLSGISAASLIPLFYISFLVLLPTPGPVVLSVLSFSAFGPFS